MQFLCLNSWCLTRNQLFMYHIFFSFLDIMIDRLTSWSQPLAFINPSILPANTEQEQFVTSAMKLGN